MLGKIQSRIKQENNPRPETQLASYPQNNSHHAPCIEVKYPLRIPEEPFADAGLLPVPRKLVIVAKVAPCCHHRPAQAKNPTKHCAGTRRPPPTGTGYRTGGAFRRILPPGWTSDGFHCEFGRALKTCVVLF
uniref:(northern house mosquito) hypothetical protein n=1 Tax=Culex pipiens TaxID=7175 RepID=A0A8D8K4V3_CULPI